MIAGLALQIKSICFLVNFFLFTSVRRHRRCRCYSALFRFVFLRFDCVLSQSFKKTVFLFNCCSVTTTTTNSLINLKEEEKKKRRV